MNLITVMLIVLSASQALGQVQSLAQTTDGKIWFSRDSDLLLYTEGKATSIGATGIHGTIREIVPDRNAGLVVATDEGVFLCLDGSCKPDPRTPSGTKLESIAVDSKGTFWGSTRTAVGYFQNSNFQSVLPSSAQALAFDQTDVLWIGSGFDLIRWENGKSQTYSLPPPPPNVRMMPPVTSLMPVSSESVYIGTRNGLFLFSGNQIMKQLDLNVVAMMRDNEGEIWIATGDSIKKMRKGKLTDISF